MLDFAPHWLALNANGWLRKVSANRMGCHALFLQQHSATASTSTGSAPALCKVLSRQALVMHQHGSRKHLLTALWPWHSTHHAARLHQSTLFDCRPGQLQSGHKGAICQLLHRHDGRVSCSPEQAVVHIVCNTRGALSPRPAPVTQEWRSRLCFSECSKRMQGSPPLHPLLRHVSRVCSG